MVFIYIALLTFYLISLVLLLLIISSAPTFISVKRKDQLEGRSSDVSFFRT